MSIQKIPSPGNSFITEVPISTFKLGNAAIVVDAVNNIATVTLTAHLLAVGDYVTFSGAATNTSFNNNTFKVVSVTSANVYVVNISAVVAALGSPTGAAIIQERLSFLGGVNPGSGANTNSAAGFWFYQLGANGVLEYNPDNNFGANGPGYGSETWRTLAAASTNGLFWTDGYNVRFRQNGTTATSNFSQVK